MGSAVSTSNTRSTEPTTSSACPIDHLHSDANPSQQNPLNQIPHLANQPAPGQLGQLPTERVISSIPRSSTKNASACPVDHSAFSKPTQSADASTPSCPSSASPAAELDERGNWVYPSPQQFHNALARKGKATSEEYVESMVEIHNWLNESAWEEIQKWERNRTRFSASMGQTPAVGAEPSLELASFQGRPSDLSPKARWHLLLGKVFPNSYSSVPPFDRHDWHVYRPATRETQRYVIDYYSCADDEHGNPVFSLDVRPAVDNPTAVMDRLRKWAQDKSSTFGFGSPDMQPAETRTR